MLADSLSRQGSEALVSGEERSDDDEFDKEGPIEEVLASCLRDQRQAVVQLEQLEKVVKAALERERKQFERLQFAFKKAGNDRAYAQSLAKLRKRFVDFFFFFFFAWFSRDEREKSGESERERKRAKGGNRTNSFLSSPPSSSRTQLTNNNTGTRKRGPRWRRS